MKFSFKIHLFKIREDPIVRALCFKYIKLIRHINHILLHSLGFCTIITKQFLKLVIYGDREKNVPNSLIENQVK